MNFISSKARVEGFLEGDNTILGSTVIGKGSILGKNVIIGYPTRKTIKSFFFSEPFDISKYDALSEGTKVGRNCVIRSGTIIYEKVTISDGVEISHNVLIREGSVIGQGSWIGSSTKLDGTVKIGKGVKIQTNVYLPHQTILKSGTFVSPNVCFTNDPYPPSKRLVGVLVEKNAVIGANSCVIAGVKIGENSVVGAGSVVTKDVQANTMVVGAPARYYTTRKDYNDKRKKWEQLE